MSGHKPFNALTEGMSQERRKSIEARKVDLYEDMALRELRKAIGASQEQMGNALNVNQPAIARMERRNDIRIQSLRRMIEAMGGELEVKARFPDFEVTLTDYQEQRT